MTISVLGKRLPFRMYRDGRMTIDTGKVVLVGHDLCDLKAKAEEYVRDDEKDKA